MMIVCGQFCDALVCERQRSAVDTTTAQSVVEMIRFELLDSTELGDKGAAQAMLSSISDSALGSIRQFIRIGSSDDASNERGSSGVHKRVNTMLPSRN